MVMLSLAAGAQEDGLASAGPTVCACFGVGLTTIRAALQSDDATSVETIGAALRAGTNCGSCLPELKRIVADAVAVVPAATPAPTTAPNHDRARDPAVMA